MKQKTFRRSVLALAVVAALGGAAAIGIKPQWGEAHAAPAATVTESAIQPPSVSVLGLPDMRSIVATQGPAVVNISVASTRKAASGFPGLDPDDPFYEFFRRFRGAVPEQRTPVQGMGSGFIIHENGTVLTNAHVVEGADEVTVKLNDKREFKAKVVGQDKTSDVAVLKIDGKNLPTVRIGSSVNTQVGEWVLAIGSPFGFENSASAGIVSAKSRSLPDGSYVPFIQTDVAVNPGNSGGPLFNMNGEVIGINSQIYSRSGGYQGLSFAIPIEVAMNVEKQLVAHGKVQRGKLGVVIQEMNQTLAESFGLDKPTGALVSSVEKGSPAAKAGLEPGDVILGINGKTIVNNSELPAAVAVLQPGDTARLLVWRQGASRNVEVKVGSFSEAKTATAPDEATPAIEKSKLGLTVRPLSAQESRQADTAGLLVENVAGPAARAGIRRGDIVIAVNGQAVKSAEQLNAAIAKSGKKAALLIERGEFRLFVPVDLN